MHYFHDRLRTRRILAPVHLRRVDVFCKKEHLGG
jgi:hypothetical protein